MFLENFTKFIKYYGKGKYLKIIGFLGLSFIAGFLEFLGIALIYPFILIIIQPDMILNSVYYKRLVDLTHITNPGIYGLVLGLAILLIFIFKNIYIIFTQYVQHKFVNGWKMDLSRMFMKYYLYSSYDNVLKTSCADKLYVINVLCVQAIDGFVMRGLNLLTNVIIVLMVVTLLLIKFPVAAIITIFFAYISISGQNKYLKKRLTDLANKTNTAFKKYNAILYENINNLKETKIFNSEKYCFDLFTENEKIYRDIQTKQGFYASIPPYVVEILVVTALLLLTATITLQKFSDSSSLIASFAIIAAALFRIAPALNRIQTCIININSTREFVRRINNEYENCRPDKIKAYDPKKKSLTLKQKIEFKNICFSYTPDKQVLNNITLQINKGDFIGIIGLSGAGKSTFADIFTGLLTPQSGEILIDGKPLTSSNLQQFRGIIGYVPQQVHITDKSFKENTAWGIPLENIDENGVIKALKAAQIYDFVAEFKDGINANPIIGTNGLSEGQKQRLAIARALYRDAEIILLDEATSSLDVQTENEITEMLSALSGSRTIIAIAHRLSTLKACNKLIYMKDGRIIDTGTFDELSQKYEEFAKLVLLSRIN